MEGNNSRAKILGDINSVIGSLEFPEKQLVTSGIITVRLDWGSQPDVDLHVYEPNGAHIYYGNKSGPSGYLDLDDTSSFGPEHYYVSCETLEVGTYKVGVNYYAGSAPETANVHIVAGDPPLSRNFSHSLSSERGSGGSDSPIPVATIKVTKDEKTGKYKFSVQ